MAVAVHPELDYAECVAGGRGLLRRRRPRRALPGARAAAANRQGRRARRAALRRAVRRSARPAGRRASRDPLGGGVRRGRHRARPHRAGLRTGGLRSRPPARAPRHRARRSRRDATSRLRAPLGDARSPTSAAPIAALLKERRLLFARAPYRHRYPTCWRCGQELIFRVADEWFLSAAEIRPLARAANERVTWLPGTCSGAWTTGSPTWATGASRASATGACPCRSTRAGAGASPWSARAGSSGSWPWIPARGGRGARAAPPVARRHPHPVPRLRAARAAHPRGRRLLARRRHRAVLDARLPRGSPAMGALVPGRLHRRGRGPAPRVVLRAALHVHGHWRARAPTGRCWRTSGCSPPTGARCTRAGATRSGSTTRSRRWAPT